MIKQILIKFYFITLQVYANHATLDSLNYQYIIINKKVVMY